MRPCGTKLPLQFGQPDHAQKTYANIPSIDTFIYSAFNTPLVSSGAQGCSALVLFRVVTPIASAFNSDMEAARDWVL
jgi:hypothetical protein